MASRRARIKTCANIPVRKKNVQSDGEIIKESAVIEQSTEEGEGKSRIEENSDINKIKKLTEKENVEKSESRILIENDEPPSKTIKDITDARLKDDNLSKGKNPELDKDNVNIQPDQSNHDALREKFNEAVNIVQKGGDKKNAEESENAQKKEINKTDDNKRKDEDIKIDATKTESTNKEEIKKPPVAGIRRRFIKPMISNNVISRVGKNKPPSESPNDINSNKVEVMTKTDSSAPSNLNKINDVIKSDSVLFSNVEVTRDDDSRNELEIMEEDDSLNELQHLNSEVRNKESFLPLLELNKAKDVERVGSLPLSVNGVTYLGEPPKGDKTDSVEYDQGVNINLNETSLPTCNNITVIREPIVKVLDVVRLPKPQYIDGTKSGSDTEYPSPAVSPSKCVNRPRIKAVPRLGRQQQRRTSFSIGSASESEEDTRKTTTRNRNDSVCSVISANGDSPSLAESSSPQKKEYSSVIQRKCRRTEQSRKLAEARRDFMMKFGNRKPDRQRLTMMDLIFYNPATSPMSQKKKRNDTTTSTTMDTEIINDPDDPKSDAKEKDDEKEKDNVSDGDEENTVPAPQITIGANGQIIVDEKSLIIENKATVKGREALKQSQIVNGDFDTSYGVYKRVKRSKDWSKEETLRFYKALNTIGTDFTMMNELFPGRTRRELKQKFKKEERMNRFLVDRAVMQPVQFDMTDLRRELEVAEIEKKEAERLKKEKEELLKERMEKNNNNNKRKRTKPNIDGCVQTSDSAEKPLLDQVKKTGRKKVDKRSINQQIVKNGINSLLDSDSDSSTLSKLSGASKNMKEISDSDSDYEEKRKKIQTTKSGRISRPRKSFDSELSNEKNCNDNEHNLKNGEPLQIGNDEKSVDETEEKIIQRKNGEKKIKSIRETIRKRIKRPRSSSNDESDSDADIPVGKIQTTKSGRISRPRNVNSDIEENENSVATKQPTKENQTTNGEEKPNQFTPEENNDSQDELTPGSLMILTETDTNGEPIQKIYTVNESGEKVPIELTQDIMEDLMKSLPDLNISNASFTANTENGDADWPSENTLANLSLGINEDDLVIDEDTMVIPFEELLAEQATVKV